MQIKFSASVNIIRDSNRKLNYITTPNAVNIANQISNDFKKGIRSFTIIGSYGTGKSAFLWALQQTLCGRQKFFNVNLLSAPKVKFLNFVGEYASITEHFANYFNI